MVQLSHPYMTTGKNTSLIRHTFIGKVMSLLFNMLSGLVTAFLPSSKCLLISWLQSPSAVILESKKRKSVLFPSFSHVFAMKWWDQMPWDQMPWSSFFECLVLSWEKKMATHSSILAWRIQGTEEPVGLSSMGSHSRVGHDWSDLAAAAVLSQLFHSPLLLSIRGSLVPPHFLP